MYHLLDCAVAQGERVAALTLEATDAQAAERDWIIGHAFAPLPLQPLRLRCSARTDAVLPALRQVPVPLMTRALYSALYAAGVANIDTYAAEIFSSEGRLLSDQYLAFNVVGAVHSGAPAAGPQLSTSRLDAAGAKGLLLFRVIDAPYALVASEVLRQRLLQLVGPQGLAGVLFKPAASWRL